MTTEAQLQIGLQTQLRAVTGFTAADVVINDYSLLDESTDRTPIAIISNADAFDALQASGNRSSGTIPLPVTIGVRFYDWQESLNAFRDIRQAIITYFEDTNGSRALGLEAVSVDSITAGGNVDYLDDGRGELPVWVTQLLLFNVELF